MHALIDFLTTDYGLMSAAVILFMIGMAGYFVWYVGKHIEEDAARHEQDEARQDRGPMPS